MAKRHISQRDNSSRSLDSKPLFATLLLSLMLVFMNAANAGLYAPPYIYGGQGERGDDPQLICDLIYPTKFYVSWEPRFYGIDAKCIYKDFSESDVLNIWNGAQFHLTYYPSCPAGYEDDGSGVLCKISELEQKQSRSSCLNPALGDPIIIATGNSFQTEVDYQSQNPFGLSFIRYYNSSNYGRATSIGAKWSHNYNSRLALNSATQALLYRNNGQVFTFNFDGNTWQGDVDIPDTLVELKDTAGNRTGWVYTDSHDNVERYNLLGQLISITSRTGQSQTLSYDIASIDGGDDDNATLDKVTGFNGDVLSFTYDSNQSVKRITSMTDPQGHTYLYSYDALGNLINVTYPDNTPGDSNDNPTRTYHYENVSFPHHLTGRTDETGSRTTWTFDSQGRAIGNELDGGAENYTLVFNSDGSVTTTNPLGKTTTYHFTILHGVKKVTQVEGHASASCVAANKNYTYDANGYLQSKTDWQGKTTTYIHNARGLETSRTEAAGTPEARTITTDWHATYRLPIKITEPGKVTDYSYDTQGRLTSQTSHTL